MSEPTLALSPDLSLPLDAATDTYGILAKKGSGKSNAAVVMAEEMHAAGVSWVAVDPKGDWYGVRSSEDGKKPGLAVPVFGGKHGDVPLEPTAGALVADLILGDEGRGYLSCILDVSQFTISDQRRFLLAFGERLYRQKDEEGVLHLFLEEAHEYLPQSVPRESTQLVSTWQRIVKLGRTKGLGITLVSQRSAALNKDVLTQVDSLIVLRTMSPQDRAVVKAWLDVHVGVTEVINTLHELAKGEAWLWAPDRFPAPVRFQFRRRRTFDSGATPEVGKVRRAPATLADVDLAAIKEQMADTIEQSKANDPKELRRRIATLEKQLAQRPAETVERVVEVEVVREVVPDGLLEALLDVEGHAREVLAAVARASGLGSPLPVAAPVVARPVQARPAVQHQPAPLPRRREPTGDDDLTLGKTERNVLSVLAQFPHGRTHRQLAMLTGYSPKASTIGVALSKLRKLGYVEPTGNPIRATPEGIEAIDGHYEPLPQGPALLDYWRNRFGKTERVVLDVLLDAYPESTTQAEIAERTGYSPQASTIGVALSKLRKVEVVEGWRMSDDFMESVR